MSIKVKKITTLYMKIQINATLLWIKSLSFYDYFQVFDDALNSGCLGKGRNEGCLVNYNQMSTDCQTDRLLLLLVHFRISSFLFFFAFDNFKY